MEKYSNIKRKQRTIMKSNNIKFIMSYIKGLSFNGLNDFLDYNNIMILKSGKVNAFLSALVLSNLVTDKLDNYNKIIDILCTRCNNDILELVDYDLAYEIAKHTLKHDYNILILNYFSNSVIEKLSDSNIMNDIIVKYNTLNSLCSLDKRYINKIIKYKRFKFNYDYFGIVFFIKNGIDMSSLDFSNIFEFFYNLYFNDRRKNLVYKDLEFLYENNLDLYDYLIKRFTKLFDENIDYLLYASDVKEALIFRFFLDNPSNVLVNIEQILDFTYKSPKHKKKVVNLELYWTLLANNNKTDLKKLYHKLLESNINIKDIYYDDYRTITDICNKELATGLLDPNNLEDLDYYKEVQVRELSGIEFNALVQCINSSGNKKYIPDFIDQTMSTISLSLISDKHIKTNIESHNVIIGFSNINFNQIIHISPEASYSYFEYTKFVNQFLTKDELIEKTENYNEIIYQEHKFEGTNLIDDNRSPLKPSYVLAIDKIEVIDFRTARRFNIPIVLLDSKSYKQEKKKDLAIIKRYV